MSSVASKTRHAWASCAPVRVPFSAIDVGAATPLDTSRDAATPPGVVTRNTPEYTLDPDPTAIALVGPDAHRRPCCPCCSFKCDVDMAPFL